MKGKLTILLSVFFITQIFSYPSNLEITKFNQSNNQVTHNLSPKKNANMWGLTVQNYDHYLWLMKNTPSGHWYKSLDPVEVLALDSKNPSKMMHFAKIQAQNMHKRVSRELAFTRIYSQAYRELYPHQKAIISPYHKLHAKQLLPGDHIWLFISTHTPLAQFIYQHIIKLIEQSPNVKLDIYFVGRSISKRSIENWAVEVGIPVAQVGKTITLNYGNYRFRKLTHNKPTDLPLIGIVYKNHFQKISLSSLL